jgi:CDP-diacylglycerol--serine O-phosphatidyltransferase
VRKRNQRHQRIVESQKFRRGVYILPNLFTTLNALFGFFAIISAMDGEFVTAAITIILAALCDGLDGKIARATNTTSRFGVEYDSLADLISFGVAPGLMVYLMALRPLGRVGWLAAFLFTICGALRLARFNTQSGKVSSDYFVGLPIPAAAGMAASATLFTIHAGIHTALSPFVFMVMLYLLSFLMVSNIRYNSFKSPELFKRMNFNVLVGLILVLVFIVAQPQIALFSIGIVYVSSGPLAALLRRKKQTSASADEERPQPVP